MVFGLPKRFPALIYINIQDITNLKKFLFAILFLDTISQGNRIKPTYVSREYQKIETN